MKKILPVIVFIIACTFNYPETCGLPISHNLEVKGVRHIITAVFDCEDSGIKTRHHAIMEYDAPEPKVNMDISFIQAKRFRLFCDR